MSELRFMIVNFFFLPGMQHEMSQSKGLERIASTKCGVRGKSSLVNEVCRIGETSEINMLSDVGSEERRWRLNIV